MWLYLAFQKAIMGKINDGMRCSNITYCIVEDFVIYAIVYSWQWHPGIWKQAFDREPGRWYQKSIARAVGDNIFLRISIKGLDVYSSHGDMLEVHHHQKRYDAQAPLWKSGCAYFWHRNITAKYQVHGVNDKWLC